MSLPRGQAPRVLPPARAQHATVPRAAPLRLWHAESGACACAGTTPHSAEIKKRVKCSAARRAPDLCVYMCAIVVEQSILSSPLLPPLTLHVSSHRKAGRHVDVLTVASTPNARSCDDCGGAPGGVANQAA